LKAETRSLAEISSAVVDKEAGLHRQLSSRQLAMIAIGGAIGTGLFLGSSLAVRAAGPAVILTFVLGAAITLLLMGALSEMSVAHPTAGSFGVHAEIYLGRWAGFVVRYTYWAVQAIAIGGEATAVAVYCRWWFPNVPSWLWIIGFSAGLLWVNARSVGSFGTFEYWFAMIKVVAIVLFIVFGAAMLLGVGHPAIGGRNFTAHGGFFPRGLSGTWMAIVFVIYGYIGAEIVAVTAGDITHLSFRRRWERETSPPCRSNPGSDKGGATASGATSLPVRMPGYPFTTLLGAASIIAILLTTWWVEGMRVTLLAGIPWLAFISLCYALWRRASRVARVYDPGGHGSETRATQPAP
jgi:L-asparagine transporter-like permease